VRDHLGRSLTDAPAPAPYGTWAGLLPSSPNHFRILADNLRVILHRHLISAALGAVANGGQREREARETTW
jgi:hypothetical protein